jgi:DNA polymerase-3 subunit beta
MHIRFQREDLLKPLGFVAGVVERRQTLPILSYLLFRAQGGGVQMTGTDLEVEVSVSVEAKTEDGGEVMLPARKLLDICRALPSDAALDLRVDGSKAQIKTGRSRFSLLTMPVTDFPVIQTADWDITLRVAQQDLKQLLQETHFCMAQQDVRYYLNGVLLETSGKTLRAVATDGHRMAVSELKLGNDAGQNRQVIVPRKGVHELIRMLEDNDQPVEVLLSNNHLRVRAPGLVFTSKLIDGRYPDYAKVMPGKQSIQLKLPREGLRETLARVAILSNEKYRGIRLTLSEKQLRISTNNPEQEEAQEELAVDFAGNGFEVGFNVNYLVECLGSLRHEEVLLGLNDPNSSCLIQVPGQASPQYVIMPMRL